MFDDGRDEMALAHSDEELLRTGMLRCSPAAVPSLGGDDGFAVGEIGDLFGNSSDDDWGPFSDANAARTTDCRDARFDPDRILDRLGCLAITGSATAA